MSVRLSVSEYARQNTSCYSLSNLILCEAQTTDNIGTSGVPDPKAVTTGTPIGPWCN